MQIAVFYCMMAVLVIWFIYINQRYLCFALCLTTVVASLYLMFSQHFQDDFMLAVKQCSVIFPIVLVSLIQYLHAKRRLLSVQTWILQLLPIVLILNVLQVALLDLMTQYYCNFIVGLILILGVYHSRKQWVISQDHIVGFTNNSTWPILYTLWNIVFLYSHTGKVVENGFIPLLLILVLALLYCLLFKKWHYWLIARAYSLYFVIALDAFYPTLFPPIYYQAPNTIVLWLLNSVTATTAIFFLYRSLCPAIIKRQT